MKCRKKDESNERGTMRGEKRRKEIIKLLKNNVEPMSGNALAKYFNVSRQVIVQDIALLKVADYNILSTYRGYMLHDDTIQKQRIFKVRHNTEQIKDELCTIVDAGGRVVDVIIYHNIYGELRAELPVVSRSDIEDFVSQLVNEKISPLKELTNDYHYHTVEADSEEILDCVEQGLKRKNYLVE